MSHPPLSWSAELEQDARDLLVDLLATPSISGQEGNAGNVLNAWFRGAGLSVSQQQVRTETANVIVSVGQGNPRLILTTHIDTVAPDPNEWQVTTPFHPLVDGDRVYGVGASDAKGIIVSLALALRYLRYFCKDEWQGTLVGAFVTEEETSGYGSKMFAESLEATEHTMAVVCEPTRLQHISLGNRGNAFVLIEAKGRERHGAYPADEYDSFRILPALQSFVLEFVGKYKDELMVPSINVTSINSGLSVLDGQLQVRSPNTTPASLAISLDIRTTPELEKNEFEALKAELQKFASSLAPLDVAYSFLMPHIPGQIIAASDPLVRATAKALKTVTGNEPSLTMAVGANDAVFFDQQGIRTLNEVGPGDFGRAHRHDEFISVEEILRGAEMYVLLAKEVLK